MFISNMTSDPHWRKHKSPQAILSSRYSTPDIRRLCGLSLHGLLTASVLHFKRPLALKCRRIAAAARRLSSPALSRCLADHIKSAHAMPAEDLLLFSLHEHWSCLFKHAPETLPWGTTAQKERGGVRRENQITLGINQCDNNTWLDQFRLLSSGLFCDITHHNGIISFNPAFWRDSKHINEKLAFIC